MTRQRGSMRERTPGKWLLTVSKTYQPSGARRQFFRTVSATTKREAQREMTAFLKDLDDGKLDGTAPGALTVERYLGDWVTTAKTRKGQPLRPNTARRYRGLIALHITPVVGALPLRDFKPEHVRRVLDRMERSDASPSSTHQAFRVLTSAMGHALALGLITLDPTAAIKPPQVDRDAQRAKLDVPDAATLATLLGATEGTWLHPVVVIAAATGMRRGEVLGLRWADVDMDTLTVRVFQAAENQGGGTVGFSQPKTKRSRRTVRVPASLGAFLRGHKAAQAQRRLLAGEAWVDLDLVCDNGDGSPMKPDSVTKALKRVAADIGRPDIRLHDLRHAFATMQMREGVHQAIVSASLGHASTAFTQDTYGHVDPGMTQAAADAIDRAIGEHLR